MAGQAAVENERLGKDASVQAVVAVQGSPTTKRINAGGQRDAESVVSALRQAIPGLRVNIEVYGDCGVGRFACGSVLAVEAVPTNGAWAATHMVDFTSSITHATGANIGAEKL